MVNMIFNAQSKSNKNTYLSIDYVITPNLLLKIQFIPFLKTIN